MFTEEPTEELERCIRCDVELSWPMSTRSNVELCEGCYVDQLNEYREYRRSIEESWGVK